MEAAQDIATAQKAGAVGAAAVSQGEGATRRSSRSLDQLGQTAGQIGLLAAAGFAVAVGASARFDKQMSEVQAATHETAANMDLLRESALQAGADTAFSATEAAQGVEELAKAG